MRDTQRRITSSLVLPLLVLGLALGACGGSGDDDDDVPSAGGSTTTAAGGTGGEDTADGLAFTECMRDQGIEMEDPDPATGVPQFSGGAEATETPEFDSAMEACQDLLPAGGIRGENEEENLDQLQAFAECMRENGMPDFPDPQPGENGVFGSDNTVDRNSPAFQSASEACQETLSGIGGDGQ
jgi:hypothetical protein